MWPGVFFDSGEEITVNDSAVDISSSTGIGSGKSEVEEPPVTGQCNVGYSAPVHERVVF